MNIYTQPKREEVAGKTRHYMLDEGKSKSAMHVMIAVRKSKGQFATCRSLINKMMDVKRKKKSVNVSLLMVNLPCERIH